MFVVVKTDNDPGSVVSAVRAAGLELDREQPIYDVKTLGERVGSSLAQPRFNTLLLGSFSGLALMLAVVGLYGVLSYAMAQRTHELGVRLALGAESRDVLKLVVGQGMKLALAGVAIGLLGSLALTRMMRGLLFGVSATDPVTYLIVAVVLAGAALAACYLPARRATRVDPMVALRYE
jgi:putative ABC transport system permease protein